MALGLIVGAWYQQTLGSEKVYFLAERLGKDGWVGVLVRHNKAARTRPKAMRTSVHKTGARLWTYITEYDVPDAVREAADNT